MNTSQCLLLPDPSQAKQWLKPYHSKHIKIGFVPTMGALHEGHLSLVKQARKENQLVCVSIFVNPLQFNNNNDLEKYPRDMDKDILMLESSGCDMVFTGALESFFPEVEYLTNIPQEDPGSYAQGLEGEFRPGHLAGVKTIVKRLFETVGDCSAYFGAKDFQQTLVIKSMAKELGYPKIIVCPTIRENNGLAMSSRNEQLTEKERKIAGKIYQSLQHVSMAWERGETNSTVLEGIMHHNLKHPEINIEYAALKNPVNWTQNINDYDFEEPPQALIAINIGDVRLIDNACLSPLLETL